MTGVRPLLERCADRIAVDVRNAVRGLHADRRSTLMSFGILTAALTLGSVTFAIVDAIVLRPLPYGTPERLVSVSQPTQAPRVQGLVSPAMYSTWADDNLTLDNLAAARVVSASRVDVGETTHVLSAIGVSTNLFEVLAVRPLLGRLFEPADEQVGAPRRVILAHGVWTKLFRSDPGVIGRRLAVGREAVEIIGVLPRDVAFPITSALSPDVYVPYTLTPVERIKTGPALFVVGRLRLGVSVEQARADFGRFTSAVLIPLHERVAGPSRAWLLLALAAIGAVLLVACVTVATLLLAHTTIRASEFATREALGASRLRLATSLVLEGVLISVASLGTALILSQWCLGIAKASLPPGFARVSAIAINERVLFMAFAVALLASVTFSGAPAWVASRSNLMGVMKAAGGQVIGERHRDRLLSALLIVNLAFVYLLLVSATFVVGGFIRATTVDLGFDPRNLMVLPFYRSLAAVEARDRAAASMALRRELLSRATTVPGVIEAAISTGGPTPLSEGSVRYSVRIQGLTGTSTEEMLDTYLVTPSYFRVMSMALKTGRLLETSDGSGAPLVIVITDIAARRFFQNREPVGSVIEFLGQPRTIVGVLRDVRHDGPEVDARPALYAPIDQGPTVADITFGALIVRTSQDVRRHAGAVREAIRPVLAEEPYSAGFVEDDFRRLTASRRASARLMGSFGVLAVALGVFGVYGTVAFFVARRIRVIGLHLAIGASPSSVLRSVLWDSLERVGFGVGLGLVSAWMVSRLLESFVFGMGVTDPTIYAAVAGVLVLIGLAASFFPALRASRVDPVAVLRQDW